VPHPAFSAVVNDMNRRHPLPAGDAHDRCSKSSNAIALGLSCQQLHALGGRSGNRNRSPLLQV